MPLETNGFYRSSLDRLAMRSFHVPEGESNMLDGEPSAYPLHFYCWVLIKETISPAAEERLGLLVKALHQKWEQGDFGLSKFILEAERIVVIMIYQPTQDLFPQPPFFATQSITSLSKI